MTQPAPTRTSFSYPMYDTIIVLFSLIAFTYGVWGIHTHSFEGDDIFFYQGTSFGRPIPDLLFGVGKRIFGANPSGYHLSLVIFHVVTTFTGFLVIREVTRSPQIAMVSTSLFLVNVSHYRVLHWVSCIGYPIALLLGLLCLLCLFQKRHILAGFLILLSVLAHPAAIGIPLTVGLHLWDRLRFWAVIITGLVAIAFVIWFFPEAPQNDNLSGFSIMAIKRFFWQMGRLITTGASTFQGMDKMTIPDFLAGCSLVFVCLLVVYWYREGSLWAFFIICATIPFIWNPSLNNWPTGPSRYLYFSSFGFCVLVGILLCKIRKSYCYSIALVIITISGWQLHETRAISAYMEGRGQIAHGNFRAGLDRYRFAINHAHHLLPVDVYERAAIIALADGKNLDPLLATAPDLPEIFALRAASALLEDDQKMAMLHFGEVLSALPDSSLSVTTARALTTIASHSFHTSNFKKALEFSNMALQFDPNYDPAQKINQKAKRKIVVF